jgi:hypothetical protein
VQSFVAAFSDAAQLPQTALFENLCVKYFHHYDLLHITAFRFADELPALGWALCTFLFPVVPGGASTHRITHARSFLCACTGLACCC